MPRINFWKKLIIGQLAALLFLSPVTAQKQNVSKPKMDQERMARIPMQLKSFVERGAMAGAVTLIARRGRVISMEAIGYRSLESNESMLVDTIFDIRSVTKPVTAIGIMSLMEEGKLALKKRLDGHWWATADSEEQKGAINGFIDCYQGTLRRYIKSGAITEEYQKALNQFYAAHPDQKSTTLTKLMMRFVNTLKSNVLHLPGGEVWTEPHGYFDGQWWRESTDKERLGFVEGYIACYERYVKKPRVRFSRTAEEYSELLTKYFEDPNADHTDEKIAHVLQRLAAKRVPARR